MVEYSEFLPQDDPVNIEIKNYIIYILNTRWTDKLLHCLRIISGV